MRFVNPKIRRLQSQPNMAHSSLAYPAGAESEEKPPPSDFLLCCNNIRNCMTKWYENIARIHGIPLIMIDGPHNNGTTVNDIKVAYICG